MKNKQKMTLKFYQNLGKVFYAIAMVDNKLQPIEFEKLKELVKKYWLKLDPLEDIYETDAAYQIEIVFDWLISQENTDTQACFNDFINYKNEQKHFFTKNVNHLIMKTARAIAASFAGINKSELIMLANLNIELKKI